MDKPNICWECIHAVPLCRNQFNRRITPLNPFRGEGAGMQLVEASAACAGLVREGDAQSG